jgi:hypothetical protein
MIKADPTPRNPIGHEGFAQNQKKMGCAQPISLTYRPKFYQKFAPF